MQTSKNDLTWIAAIRDRAATQGLRLPEYQGAMGTLTWQTADGDRAVTLKHRMLPVGRDSSEAVRWAVWDQSGDVRLVSICSDSKHPQEKRVSLFVDVLKRWLVDRVSEDQIKGMVGAASELTEASLSLPEIASGRDFAIGNDGEITFEIRPDSWKLASRNRRLTFGRYRGGVAFDSLPKATLENLVRWLSENWRFIAYAADSRPSILLESSAWANRAYEFGRLNAAGSPEMIQEIDAWRSRHAIRTADPLLPNVYIERQEDDVVFSWDSSPSQQSVFDIGYGIEAIPADIAVPRLHDLLAKCIGSNSLLVTTNYDATLGYEILNYYHHKEEVTPHWLSSLGFDKAQSATFAIAGTSRHPVVGLLRSSRSTSLTLADIKVVLERLRLSDAASYKAIRELAIGLDARLDPREPWESGYQLARQVRERLALPSTLDVVIEDVFHNLRIDYQKVPFTDSIIRGACVGSPQYRPAVFINDASDDARGESGSRITAAHELCHLLFDRSRMRGLARFEGGAADSDRLFEMRANAFAVEFLVPMEVLRTANSEKSLGEISKKYHVSTHALRAHAENFRNR